LKLLHCPWDTHFVWEYATLPVVPGGKKIVGFAGWFSALSRPTPLPFLKISLQYGSWPDLTKSLTAATQGAARGKLQPQQ